MNLNQEVAKWLNDHPFFKVNGMCKVLNLNAANLYKSIEAGSIPEKFLPQIIKIISNYGFKQPPVPPFHVPDNVDIKIETTATPTVSPWQDKLIRREPQKKKLPSFLTGKAKT